MKLKNISLYAFCCIIIVGLTGCIKKIKRGKLESIELGTPKDLVIEKLGEPLAISTVKKTDKNIEIFQYATNTTKNKFSRVITIAAHTVLSICSFGLWIPFAIATESVDYAPYFLYFTNNKLTQSGTVELNI